MVITQEVFSFPIEILDGPHGERNFEMYRAELRHLSQEPTADQNFDLLVRRLSDPFEINFEMIHMVDYVRTRVDSTVFDCFQSPILSAEFWLHHLHRESLRLNGSLQTSRLEARPSTSAVATQTEGCCVVQKSTTDSRKSHRKLPGFNTILQCGATPIGGNVFVMDRTTAAASNSPTSGRINQLFSDGITSLWPSLAPGSVKQEASNHPSKENVPLEFSAEHGPQAMDTSEVEMNSDRKIPKNVECGANTNWSHSHPLGKSAKPCLSVGNTHNQSTNSRLTEGEPSSKKPVSHTKVPFEIFHDSYIQDSVAPLTSRDLTSVTNIEPSENSASSRISMISMERQQSLKTSPDTKPYARRSVRKVVPIDVESMDDTAIFALLDQQLAAASKHSGRSKTHVLQFDSPTRVVEQVLEKHRIGKRLG